MAENPRSTLMGWGLNAQGTPIVALQIDEAALDHLQTTGAALIRAPRDSEGRHQIILLLGPEANAATMARAVAALKTAEEDLPPIVPRSP